MSIPVPFETISTPVLDLYVIGPGPSSSHTIAPLRAAGDFRRLLATLPADRCRQGKRLRVTLYGSLSATGRGHGTALAILAGLQGYTPEQGPVGGLQTFQAAVDTRALVRVGDQTWPLLASDMVYDCEIRDFPFANTLRLQLLDHAHHTVLEREYYSPGGGVVTWKGQPEALRNPPVHPYSSMRSLRRILETGKLSLPALMLDNEQAMTGLSTERILEELDKRLAIFEQAVSQGLQTEGLLPGTLRYPRRAPAVFRRAQRLKHQPGHFMLCLSAYALAAAETNAAGETVVTAPTCGSFGVMAATLYLMRHHLGYDAVTLRNALLSAGAIGLIVKHTASVSGAEVGCQGEIGVAAAMAAAMLAQTAGQHVRVIENAAEKALEHHLGMTCDPIGGYVQIPCIERNAMGAVKAYTACLLAQSEQSGHHRIALDSVIRVMDQTGRDLMRKYRETAEGGLAHV